MRKPKLKPGQPVCANHGCNNGCAHSGRRYRPVCQRCHQAGYGKGTYKKGVTPIRKTVCDNADGRLGFPCATGGKDLPSCMFDLDHIDGDRDHNVPENLQTLDKCCHAEKTKREGDSKRQDRYGYIA